MYKEEEVVLHLHIANKRKGMWLANDLIQDCILELVNVTFQSILQRLILVMKGFAMN